MPLRLFITVVFLFAQLSLSWAAGMGVDHAASAVADHMHTGDIVSDNVDPHDDGSHDDGDCKAECQVCALVLPSVARISGGVAPLFETIAVLLVVPPGTVAHPFRPPAYS